MIASCDFRVTVDADRAKPYEMSLFNVSAMRFGALSANAIRALNHGAKKGGFGHDTGEGSISMHHRELGGDLIWQVASGSATAMPTAVSTTRNSPPRLLKTRSR